MKFLTLSICSLSVVLGNFTVNINKAQVEAAFEHIELDDGEFFVHSSLNSAPTNIGELVKFYDEEPSTSYTKGLDCVVALNYHAYLDPGIPPKDRIICGLPRFFTVFILAKVDHPVGKAIVSYCGQTDAGARRFTSLMGASYFKQRISKIIVDREAMVKYVNEKNASFDVQTAYLAYDELLAKNSQIQEQVKSNQLLSVIFPTKVVESSKMHQILVYLLTRFALDHHRGFLSFLYNYRADVKLYSALSTVQFDSNEFFKDIDSTSMEYVLDFYQRVKEMKANEAYSKITENKSKKEPETAIVVATNYYGLIGLIDEHQGHCKFVYKAISKLRSTKSAPPYLVEKLLSCEKFYKANLPGAVLFLLVMISIIGGLIYCCCRCCRKKNTPAIQTENYNPAENP